MSPSKETIQEFKEIFKKDYGKELTDGEASESANNLVGLFRVLYESAKKEREREIRLKKEPEGFHLTDGIYNCCICHTQVEEDSSWYDKNGIKCLLCQKAVKDDLIPSFTCRERESWYGFWELENKFGIKHPTARKLVRKGKLKARIVPYENGNPYEYVFLKKENPDLVDPDRKSPARKSYDKNYEKIAKERVKNLNYN
jgi:hypothetical protein